MVRGVGGAGGEVGKERAVRHEGLLLADPVDRMIGQILCEVVALLGCRRRLNRGGSVVQRRVPLVVLAADEAVERLEPATGGRPRIEGTERRGLPHRHLVALAELGRRVAVELQRHGQRGLGVGPHRAVAGRRCGRLGDRAHPNGMVVAAAEHRSAGRGTQCRGVKPVVAQAAGGELLGVGGGTRATEGGRRPEPDVVEQHDQHVGCALGRQQRLDRRKVRLRVLGVVSGVPKLGTVRDRQHRAGMAVGSVRHRWSPVGLRVRRTRRQRRQRSGPTT